MAAARPPLRLAPVDHAVARFACTHWHYSKTLPNGKYFAVGVWEDDEFKGVIMFGRGAAKEIGSPYKLPQTQICELVRIALRAHEWPVSRMMAIAIKLLKKSSPGLRMIVSYADTGQDHHGGIYQATNWLYVGASASGGSLVVNGKATHPRTISARGWSNSVSWLRKNVDPRAHRAVATAKHKYLFPLDEAMREQVEPLRKPYPKRAGSTGDDAPASQAGEGGLTPTPALHSSEVD